MWDGKGIRAGEREAMTQRDQLHGGAEQIKILKITGIRFFTVREGSENLEWEKTRMSPVFLYWN